MCWRTLCFALACSVCNYVNVKYVPTLERPQEATVLNKSLIEAFDLPISLESEIISILPFPCHLPVFFFFYLNMGASWVSVN